MFVIKKRSFTLIELVFVIVVLSIIGGIAIIQVSEASLNATQKEVRSRLEDEVRLISELLAQRLKYSIGDSVAYFRGTTCIDSVQNSESTQTGGEALVWIGVSHESYMGEWNSSLGYYQSGWNGYLDDNNTTTGSNLTFADAIIKDLTNNTVSLAPSSSAKPIIYFPHTATISGVCGDFDWNNTQPIPTSKQFFRVSQQTYNTFTFVDSPTNKSDYYQLSHSAYAVSRSFDGNLTLYSNFRPWEGQNYTQGTATLLGKNVSKFGFTWENKLLRLNICVSDAPRNDVNVSNIYHTNLEVCREKTVFLP